MENQNVEKETLDPNLNMEGIEEAFKLGFEQSDSVKKSIDTLLDNINKGMVIQDALGISDGTKENLYNQAYQMYQAGRYVDALRVFRVLVLLCAEDPRFAFGIASCFHMLKEYKNAIEAYMKCLLLDATNPLPFYHSADCYVHMDNKFGAIISLEMALKRAEKRPEFQPMVKRAHLFMESLRQEMAQ